MIFGTFIEGGHGAWRCPCNGSAYFNAAAWSMCHECGAQRPLPDNVVRLRLTMRELAVAIPVMSMANWRAVCVAAASPMSDGQPHGMLRLMGFHVPTPQKLRGQWMISGAVIARFSAMVKKAPDESWKTAYDRWLKVPLEKKA